MPQATVTFPYNTLQSYSGGTNQDYQLAIDCPITPGQTPSPLTVTPGSPSLIVLAQGYPPFSGGQNQATITAGPTYQNGQIRFTVRATPDPAYAAAVTNVIINLNVAVSYQFTGATDGLTPTAAVTMFQGSMNPYACGLHGSDPQNDAFYGHSPSVAGTAVYPSGSMFAASVAIQPPLGKSQAGNTGDAGDVTVNVNGSGSPTCATVYVKVNVNTSQ